MRPARDASRPDSEPFGRDVIRPRRAVSRPPVTEDRPPRRRLHGPNGRPLAEQPARRTTNDDDVRVTSTRPAWQPAALLGALWIVYPLFPEGTPRLLYYDVIGGAAILLGVLGTRHLARAARRAWLLVLVGYAGWVVGDVVFSVEQHVLHLTSYPLPSDALYLGSYVVIAVGLVRLLRGRRHRADPTPLLEASIVAAGFGIVVGTFLVIPIAESSDLSLAGRLAASAYPVADVALLTVLVRVWAGVGARTAAFRLLLVAIVSTLVADILWNVLAMSDVSQSYLVPDMLWLFGYVTVAVAACTSSAGRIGLGGTGSGAPSPRRRLLALGSALVLPGITLLTVGLLGREIPWRLVAAGSIVVSALVLARLGLLLRTVEVQAVQLAALARNDGLTGAPNRRTWDHELGHACRTADDTGAPLTVALIDLDHFKRYNDQLGHQAGDLLLREAVAAWSSALRPGELLARYGGEEFGVLLPGCTVEEAGSRLGLMMELTPRGQSVSIGVAGHTPGATPESLVEHADRALYDAKHAGRGCLRVAGLSPEAPSLPGLRIVLQPIVDLRTGRTVGHEALSRFSEAPPDVIFARARQAGLGNELEAAAVRSALRHRSRDGSLWLNVSVEALVGEAVRSVLPEDLDGIVLEITERTEPDDWEPVTAAIEDARRRGARVALDDWGSGFSNVDRLLRLRPDVVKMDRDLLTDLHDPARLAAVNTLADWARGLGAQVCAEGIETEEQMRALQRIGVELGQGFHSGRPQGADEVDVEDVATLLH